MQQSLEAEVAIRISRDGWGVSPSGDVGIDKAVALAIHEEQFAEHGAPRACATKGVRDEGALELTLGRPLTLKTYDDPPPDIADLAAAYAFGIASNHPFVDGNKRTSLVAAGRFLALDGRRPAPDPMAVEIRLKLASGTMDKKELADWLRSRISRETLFA